jgi:uncharacterized RDD family membrane protein YckC
VTNGRDVVIGLAVRTGRIGATTGRLVLAPARVVGRSPIAARFRGRTEGLAETGRSAGVDARRRLEMVVEEVLATPEAEQIVDGVLAGALPEAIARSLVEHRVIERVVVEALASAELEAEDLSARESERTQRVVAQVLASPALERALADALGSQLTLDFTERLVHSPAFRLALTNVLSSSEVRVALTGQSKSLAEEMATGLRHRVHRLDDTAERGPRRWFRRPPRAQVAAAGEASPVAYAGFAARGVALTVDAALAAMIFLTGTAVVGLVGSLVWHPHWPASLVALLLAVAGLLVNVLYFAGFWSTAGQTPGMRLMHLRVVDRSGSPPGLGRSLVRLVGLALAILLLFTGFLPALVDDRRRALQDFLARTLILYTKDEPLPTVDTIDNDAHPDRRPKTDTTEEFPVHSR